jgi:hypothetical protein
MSTNKKMKQTDLPVHLPSVEEIRRELTTAESIDDFFSKDGIFARLFSQTLETMLEAELTEHLGYERYEAKGRNSGNNRNGKHPRTVRTSGGDALIQAPATAMANTNLAFWKSTRPTATKSKRRSSTFTPKESQPETSRKRGTNCMVSMCQRPRSARLRIRCGCWSKFGRTDP